MRPAIAVNPGAGPVGGATKKNAEACVRQFITDLELAGVTYEYVKPCLGITSVGKWPDISYEDGEPDGRFEFLLRRGDLSCTVDMPGLPVDEVRYLGQPQNIWNFPRLYVDGGSWVWKYGVGIAQGALSGDEECSS